MRICLVSICLVSIMSGHPDCRVLGLALGMRIFFVIILIPVKIPI